MKQIKAYRYPSEPNSNMYLSIKQLDTELSINSPELNKKMLISMPIHQVVPKIKKIDLEEIRLRLKRQNDSSKQPETSIRRLETESILPKTISKNRRAISSGALILSISDQAKNKTLHKKAKSISKFDQSALLIQTPLTSDPIKIKNNFPQTSHALNEIIEENLNKEFLRTKNKNLNEVSINSSEKIKIQDRDFINKEQKELQKIIKGNPFINLLKEYEHYSEIMDNSSHTQIEAVSPLKKKRRDIEKMVRTSIQKLQVYTIIQNNSIIDKSILKLKELKIMILQNSNSLDIVQFLEEIQSRIRLLKNIPLFLKFSFVHASILEIFNHLDQALRVHFQTLKYCNYYQYYFGKVIPYKLISLLYLKNKNYDLSILFLKKLLQYSWLYEIKDVEIYSFEQISKLFFYQGKLQQAQYFYNKSIRGQYEDKNTSIVRKRGQELVLEQQKKHRDSLNDDTFITDDFEFIYFTNQDFIEHRDSVQKNDFDINLQDKFLKNYVNKISNKQSFCELGPVRWENRFLHAEQNQQPEVYLKERERIMNQIYVNHLSHSRNSNSNKNISIINSKGEYNHQGSYQGSYKKLALPILMRIINLLIDDLLLFSQGKGNIDLNTHD